MTDEQLSSRPSLVDAPAPSGRYRSLGLERNPFAGSGPFVPDAARREALGTIRDWIAAVSADASRDDRLAVLTAGTGMGKSRLLREVAAGLGGSIQAPLIDPGKGGLTDAQLLRAIIDAFGGTATGRTGMELRRDIRHALAELPEGVVPGLLIDDADYSGARLELIRNVLRDGAGRGLFIVLAGLPDLADRLGRRRSFRAILGPATTLGEMDDAALREMLASRTDAAGSRRGRPLIDTGAFEAMAEWAGGNPGRLLRLAELGVEAAARLGAGEVDRAAVTVAIAQANAAEGGEGHAEAGTPIQAEIPLLAGPGGAGASPTTTQRTLWDGGTGDDRAPD